MKNIFLKIVLIFFLLCNISFAKTTKFIYITGINLENNKESVTNFKSLIKEMNSMNDIDFIVFGGNNIANPKIDNFKAFCNIIKKINKKSIVLLGSNDVFSQAGLDKSFYLKKINKSLKFKHSKKPNYTFEKNNILFVVMDGSKQYFKSSNGYYSNNELFWLENILEKNKNKKNIVILQHFPIIETKSLWLMTGGIEEYLNLLKDYNNVKLIISGHYGINLETEFNGIKHILTEDYSKNDAYRIIELDFDNNFVGSHLVK